MCINMLNISLITSTEMVSSAFLLILMQVKSSVSTSSSPMKSGVGLSPMVLSHLYINSLSSTLTKNSFTTAIQLML